MHRKITPWCGVRQTHTVFSPHGRPPNDVVHRSFVGWVSTQNGNVVYIQRTEASFTAVYTVIGGFCEALLTNDFLTSYPKYRYLGGIGTRPRVYDRHGA